MIFRKAVALLALLLPVLLSACGGGGGGGTPKPPPLKLPSATLKEAHKNWNYWTRLNTPQSPGPFHFELVSGTLPKGLALDEDTGELQGKPQAEGKFVFHVAVEDKGNPKNSMEWIFTLQVASPWTSTPPVSRRYNFFFIHHSVGQNLWIRGPLIVELYKQNYMPFDMTYTEGKVDGYVIGDHTDIPDWPTNFNTPKYFQVMYTWELKKPGEHHDIIAFKSCFPNSNIESEARLEEFKKDYLSLLPTFKAHPEVLFVPFTTPPLNPAATNKANAARARRLANWLKYEYSAKLPNVIAFDFFDILANPPDDPTEPNMLKKEYRSGTDSHPTAAGDKAVTAAFLPFLNAAMRAAGIEP